MARRRFWIQQGTFFLALVVFLGEILYREFGQDWQANPMAALFPTMFGIVLALTAVGFGTMKGLRRTRSALDSYELMIGEDFLLRRIKDFPELEIQREEITEIKEGRAGLHVATASRDRMIGIPPAVVDYADAKERLSHWKPIQQSRQTSIPRSFWNSIASLFTLSLLYILFVTDKSWVAVATGAPLLGDFQQPFGICAGALRFPHT